jgi:hypothetical protein
LTIFEEDNRGEKIILLAIYVLFFVYAASSEAATGLDKYKGAFGPKIKGIQLGAPVTIPEFMKLAEQHLVRGNFYYNGGWFLVAYNSIEEFLADVDSHNVGTNAFTLYDSKNKRWKFDGNYPEYKEILARPIVVLFPYSIPPMTWMAVKSGSDFRVWAFTLPASVFNAQGMSTEFFAQEIMVNYGVHLTSRADWREWEWKTPDSHRYENGWNVLVKMNGTDLEVSVRASKTVSGTTFN